MACQVNRLADRLNTASKLEVSVAEAGAVAVLAAAAPPAVVAVAAVLGVVVVAVVVASPLAAAIAAVVVAGQWDRWLRGCFSVFFLLFPCVARASACVRPWSDIRSVSSLQLRLGVAVVGWTSVCLVWRVS